MLTTVIVTGTFERPDGTPAEGSVIATLTAPIKNGTTSVVPTPEVGIIQAGKLLAQSLGAFSLIANDDVGTEPAGTEYVFVIELDGAPVREFFAVVPHTAGTVDITALES